MSVCVACNLSDGVIIGVDSATTIGDPLNPIKIYSGVDKLFSLGTYPIGLATFGVASIGGRTIASWAAEFSSSLSSSLSADYTMAEVAEAVRSFFFKQYDEYILKPLEAAQVDPTEKKDLHPPLLGLVLGGFSQNSFQSEVWYILLPFHREPNSALCQLPPGQYASAWYASMAPIHRYTKGFDNAALQGLVDYIGEIREPLTQDELAEFNLRAAKAEFSFVFPGMPIAKGVEYVRFLIELVIGHHKFAAGDPIVGGDCKVGFVTFKKDEFKIVTEWSQV